MKESPYKFVKIKEVYKAIEIIQLYCNCRDFITELPGWKDVS